MLFRSARAAVRSGSILLLDEPTSGLDNASKALLAEALPRLEAGRLSILISHDLPAAADADEILYVEAGRIAERGTHSSLMALGGRYAALYLQQDAARREDAGQETADVAQG